MRHNHADGEQFVEYKERVAPIGIDALGAANRFKVSFGASAPMYRKWLCDSIDTLHVRAADGLWLDAATPENIGLMSIETVDWLLGGAISVALEIPLA